MAPNGINRSVEFGSWAKALPRPNAKTRSTSGASDDLDMCREFTGDRIELLLTRGYVHLCYAGADGNGVKTVSLARFGDYEVRLVEFVRARPADPTPMWLELYNHQTQFGIDSCCCYDLEEAVHATEDLISRARELDEESRSLNCEGAC
jgi:hypothetical protein